jgi:hypothetical protein
MRSTPNLALLLIALFAVLFVACAPARLTSGITELRIDGLTLIASECDPGVLGGLFSGDQSVFPSWQSISSDGGVSWTEPELVEVGACERNPDEFAVNTPEGTSLFEKGQDVVLQSAFRSDAFDTSFLTDPLLRMMTVDQVIERAGIYPGYADTAFPGPFDAVVDPATSNLVVAMGLQGSLLRTPSGRWSWVAIGDYQRVTDSFADRWGVFLGKGVLAHVIFVGLYAALWPLVLRRAWIVRPGQPWRSRAVHPGLAILAGITIVWLLQWWGLGGVLSSASSITVVVVGVLVGISYSALEVSWTNTRPLRPDFLKASVITAVAAGAIVAAILFLWTQSVVESLTLAKWLIFPAVAPISVAYYRWLGPRLALVDLPSDPPPLA